jgi:monoamine oxidase
MYDVIIIGGGAAGLMAMKILLEADYKVCLLEAAPTAGGRIETLIRNGIDDPAEAGAEFIHGELPLTLQLLKEAGIQYEELTGNMIRVQNGEWKKGEEQDNHWEEMLQKLDTLEADMTIKDFLDTYFIDQRYTSLVRSVKSFAEGFDLADISNASILAIKDEWKKMDETQYRLPGGYAQLVQYLVDACKKMNGTFHFNSVVSKVDHSENKVKVFTADDKKFESTKVVITASAGVLKSGSIQFEPAIGQHAEAIKQLGFGAVVKVLLWFNNPFWKKHAPDMGFLLTDEDIPTWWTQLPAESSLLTGWLGGPNAAIRSGESETSFLRSSLLSLSAVFKLAPKELEEQLLQYEIINWHNKPFIKGGYSYNSLESAAAKRVLAEPVNGTIYFAGEAVYAGESQGTVEAALQSGVAAAEKIIRPGE